MIYKNLDDVDYICPQIHAFRRERLDMEEIVPSMVDYQDVLYDTSQFDVNSIINYRIENSECRIFSREEADIFYVDFFLGPLAAAAWKDSHYLSNAKGRWTMLFDYVHHVMRTGQSPLPESFDMRQDDGDGLIKALDVLRNLPDSKEWKRCHGCDHFMVSGRIGMDFKKMGGILSNKGTKGLLPPQKWQNVTFLSIEGDSPSTKSYPFFTGIPYPGHIHPASLSSLNHLRKLISIRRKQHMISFVGMPMRKRAVAIDQCQKMPDSTCVFMPCNRKADSLCKTHGAVTVLEVYANSAFCYEPHGDSPTRQGYFDAISVGCIPVVPDTKSFDGYGLHIYDATKFTLIASDINEAVEKINELGKEGYARMFQNLLEALPHLVYAHQDTGFDDAISIMMKGIDCKAKKRQNMIFGASNYSAVDAVKLPIYC